MSARRGCGLGRVGCTPCISDFLKTSSSSLTFTACPLPARPRTPCKCRPRAPSKRRSEFLSGPFNPANSFVSSPHATVSDCFCNGVMWSPGTRPPLSPRSIVLTLGFHTRGVGMIRFRPFEDNLIVTSQLGGSKPSQRLPAGLASLSLSVNSPLKRFDLRGTAGRPRNLVSISIPPPPHWWICDEDDQRVVFGFVTRLLLYASSILSKENINACQRSWFLSWDDFASCLILFFCIQDCGCSEILLKVGLSSGQRFVPYQHYWLLCWLSQGVNWCELKSFLCCFLFLTLRHLFSCFCFVEWRIINASYQMIF